MWLLGLSLSPPGGLLRLQRPLPGVVAGRLGCGLPLPLHLRCRSRRGLLLLLLRRRRVQWARLRLHAEMAPCLRWWLVPLRVRLRTSADRPLQLQLRVHDDGHLLAGGRPVWVHRLPGVPLLLRLRPLLLQLWLLLLLWRPPLLMVRRRLLRAWVLRRCCGL